MSDFKLSIITINRNNAEGLRKTIESVLSQKDVSPDEFEYIIVDGASTDGSVDVIKELESRTDFPLKITNWTSEPDTGIYNAMNKGIKKATGTLVGIINSGDEFLPNAFEGLKELSMENPDAILYGAFAGYKNGKFDHVQGHSASKLPVIMVPHNACFVPNSVYKKFGLYDENFKICADHELFAKFSVNNVKFIWLKKLICNFDMAGISSTQIKLLKRENYLIEKKYASEIYKKKKLQEKTIIWIKRIIKGGVFFLLGVIISVLYFIFRT